IEAGEFAGRLALQAAAHRLGEHGALDARFGKPRRGDRGQGKRQGAGQAQGPDQRPGGSSAKLRQPRSPAWSMAVPSALMSLALPDWAAASAPAALASGALVVPGAL